MTHKRQIDLFSLAPWFAAFLSLFLFSCASSSGTSRPVDSFSVLGEWDIEQIEGDAMIELSSPSIVFEDSGRVHGDSGVNQFSGSWSERGDELQLSQLISTRRAGPPAMMEQEHRLLEALGRAKSASGDESGRLHLHSEDGAVLVRAVRRAIKTSPEAKASLTGTVTYRERMALRPGHRLVVELQDVSRADAIAEVLGRVEIDVAGQVPIEFELPYDATQIDDRHRYSVRATLIDGDGDVAWRTADAYPVLTNGSPIASVEIVLERAR